MRYAGHINYKIGPNPNGRGWLAQFKCPAAGCGADGTLTGDNELGPFDGSCSRGHEVYVPYVVKTSNS
ncbi:hypothetical protein ABZ912_20125 [Nonomuraea angiospora]|uniref:hypothetical protein n=1 Tax=Nonomuraea angiospora TaxID=46172 RepID=UPI0033C473C4